MRISSEGTKNQRAHCYETDRSRALDTGGEKPDSNHGGVAVVGCDLYNQTITGETAATLNASSGNSPTHSGPSVIGVDLYNQTATGDVAMSITGAATDPHHVPCVCVEPDDSIKDNNDPQSVVCIEGNGVRESHKGDGYKESDTMYTLNTVEQHAVAYGISSYDSNAMKSPNPHSGVYEADTSRTLDLNGGSPACNQGGVAVVSYGLDRASYNQGKNAKYDFSIEEEKIGSMTAKGPGAVFSTVVRRMTPFECGRLQGYPDGWMDIGEWTDSKGKLHKDSDAPKYKAAGNSIALPFWQWLMDRIAKQLKKDGYDNPTMASLFDGISGFPLCATRSGIKPVWSSEIEKFPMAVAERHFGENGDYKQYL